MFSFNVEQRSEALNKSHLVYPDNLRDRDEILRQDCFIRGSLAEIWFRDFFKHYGFQVETNLKDGNTDVDLNIKGLFLNSQSILFNIPIKIEIKTSLIPNENFDIYNQGDLKIYANNDNPINDIYWDIGIQVYYNELKQEWEQGIADCNSDSDLILKYQELQFSCSWVCKDTTIQYLNNPLNKRTWEYGNKKFWHCPLKIHNHNIYESVIYLMSILLNEYSYKINLLQNEIQCLQNYQP